MLSIIIIGAMVALLGCAIMLLWLLADVAGFVLPLADKIGLSVTGAGLIIMILGGVLCLAQVIAQSTTT